MENEEAIVYIDGSSRGNPGRAGIGVVIFSKDNLQKPIAEITKYIGITTNNVAEYEALIYALRWLNNHHIKKAKIRLDSELIYKQIMGEYKVKKSHLFPLTKRVISLLNSLKEISLELIPRTENKRANRLAQKASKSTQISKSTDKKND
ncbi:MAG: ribonuclease HI family protein [bacterium]